MIVVLVSGPENRMTCSSGWGLFPKVKMMSASTDGAPTSCSSATRATRGNSFPMCPSPAGAHPRAGRGRVDTLDPAHGGGEMTRENGRQIADGRSSSELGLVVWHR